MRRLFLPGVVLLVLFECANVYFIMPMPGSQRMRSLDLAYALWSARWVVRAIAGSLMAFGALGLIANAPPRVRYTTIVPGVAVVALVSWIVNFRMAADAMFLQPRTVRLVAAERNTVALDRLVVGIDVQGQARAYPLQVIGYHHHLRDTVGGEPVLVTYCTVCRTGRVYSPVLDNAVQQFRLVGMDHFNAMLEDVRTGSWWRQANGEAVVGPSKGTMLREIPSRQVTLRQWLALYPDSRILQPDSAFTGEYAKDYAYERGTSRKKLTGTDTASWRDKSWVVGMTVRGVSRAYDWNALERDRVINDVLNGTPIVLALASDSASFYAFERPDAATVFRVENDSLKTGDGSDVRAFAFNGKGPSGSLIALVASQEFWHSWRTFQPNTDQFPAPLPAGR